MKELLIKAKAEIESLRRRNAILGAKVEVMDLFAMALSAAPGRVTIGEHPDVAWTLGNRIKELEAEEMAAKAALPEPVRYMTKSRGFMLFSNACRENLLSAIKMQRLPSGVIPITIISGVAGSGKSQLLHHILCEMAAAELREVNTFPLASSGMDLEESIRDGIAWNLARITDGKGFAYLALDGVNKLPAQPLLDFVHSERWEVRKWGKAAEMVPCRMPVFIMGPPDMEIDADLWPVCRRVQLLPLR